MLCWSWLCLRSKGSLLLCFCDTVHVEPELLHTYSKIYKSDVILLIVRLAVLTAVTLTVPVVLFPVSVAEVEPIRHCCRRKSSAVHVG